MEKKSGSSWLTIVKKAFGSPSKDARKNGSRSEEHHQEGKEKKKGKRSWLFMKQSVITGQVQQKQCEEKVTDASTTSGSDKNHAIAVVADVSTSSGSDKNQAIALAAARAAAADAAVAAARAAAEVIRLTRQPSGSIREEAAAVIIQAAFRGHLARRAQRALRGLVRLQALFRGHNVRRQVAMTLKSIEALKRAQDMARKQRARLSYEGSRKSDLIDDLWVSKCLRDSKSTGRTRPEKLPLYVCDELESLPHSISGLKVLEVHDLGECPKLLPCKKLAHLHICAPPSRFPSTGFRAEFFVEIEFSGCFRNEQAWLGRQCFGSLRVIGFSKSNLKKLPDLSEARKARRLVLQGCIKLVDISSIQYLVKLEHLDLKGCVLLTGLPSIMHLENLISIDLSYCRNLKRLRPSLGCLSRLAHLNLRNCKRLENLPISSFTVKSIQSLDISGCSVLIMDASEA